MPAPETGNGLPFPFNGGEMYPMQGRPEKKEYRFRSPKTSPCKQLLPLKRHDY